MYMFNSYLSHYINLYIDIKQKLGFKFEAQVGIFKMIDKELPDSKHDAICIECQFVPNAINTDTDEDRTS